MSIIVLVFKGRQIIQQTLGPVLNHGQNRIKAVHPAVIRIRHICAFPLAGIFHEKRDAGCRPHRRHAIEMAVMSPIHSQNVIELLKILTPDPAGDDALHRNAALFSRLHGPRIWPLSYMVGMRAGRRAQDHGAWFLLPHDVTKDSFGGRRPADVTRTDKQNLNHRWAWHFAFLLDPLKGMLRMHPTYDVNGRAERCKLAVLISDLVIKTPSDNSPDKVQVRLAAGPDEIDAAQRLRYKVFYEEYAATPTEQMAAEKRDFDEFDSVADHLIVVDETLPASEKIVGTYRLLRREIAESGGGFYSRGEYDLKPLLDSGAVLLELGRSCVLGPYRTRPILQKLWEGIAHYVAEHNIGLMFGCASLHGTDVSALSTTLAYLHHYHLAPENLRPRALEDRYVDMNLHPREDIDAKAAFSELPPLIKGYLRLGASIGEGAVIDHQFNSTDVCIVMPTHLVTSRYMKHYQRLTQNNIVLDDTFAERLRVNAPGS